MEDGAIEELECSSATTFTRMLSLYSVSFTLPSSMDTQVKSISQTGYLCFITYFGPLGLASSPLCLKE